MSEAPTRERKRKKKQPEKPPEQTPEDIERAERVHAFQEAKASAPHLRVYLDTLDYEALGGEPEFYPKADRSAGDVPFKNFIYDVGNGLFVHIISDPEDARDTYAAIEPSMVDPFMSTHVAKIDVFLLDYVDELEACEDDEQKKEVILRAIDDHVKVGKSGGGARGFNPFGRRGGRR
jgi:hypothetical protein